MNNSILNISLNRGAARIKAALFLGAIAFLIAFSVSVNSTAVAELLRPAMSQAVLSGGWGRFSSAFVIAIIVSGFTYFLLALPDKLQSRLVWALLAIGALSTFYSFDLSFTFIGKKIPFLISQGAVTTIYVSAISILLAFIFAMLGATAKLSGISILKGIGDF